MKLMHFTGVCILACHFPYVSANSISTAAIASARPSDSKNKDTLDPIRFEVASNGILTPGNSIFESAQGTSLDDSHFDELGTVPVILHDNETQDGKTQGDGNIDKETLLTESSHIHDENGCHSDKSEPSPVGRLRIGHGSLVLPHLIRTSGMTLNISSSENTSTRFLVIPLPRIYRHLSLLASSSPNPSATPNDAAPLQTTARSSATRSPIEHSQDNNINSFLEKKSVEEQIASDNTPSDRILPTIPRCLSLLEPLRDLAKRLVYIEEAPYHTLVSVCHFHALNETNYDGAHIEHMRKLCWDLFETIQQEGRRRWERCLFNDEGKHSTDSSSSSEIDPIYKSELEQFSFRAYQLSPSLVKEFIAEHPDLSPDDIEWLMHDVKSSNDNFSEPVSHTNKRSWIGDLFKSVFAAEIDTTISQIGKGVSDELQHEYQQKSHAENKTSSQNHAAPVKDKTKSEHIKQAKKPAHIHRNPQPNRVDAQGKYYPIAPIEKYINRPRAVFEVPFSHEDIDSYLEFVQETSHLSRKQSKKLRAAVERELRLYPQLESLTGGGDNVQTDHSNDIRSRNMDRPSNEKRSGPPPRLGSSYRRPYEWGFPPDLGTNPAYINLTLAWKNTVTEKHKEWIALQLRNVWVLRVGDLCKISHSWTKDLSRESQEIELNFKGLSLQRCQEIQEGTRGNWRVEDYWKSLKWDAGARGGVE